MKVNPHAPEHAADIAAISGAAARAALAEAAERGWSRQVAGVCLMTAAVQVLLEGVPPTDLASWVRTQAANLEALDKTAGHA